MFTLTVNTNSGRANHIVSKDRTIKQALEDAGVDYSKANIYYEGSALVPGDINKTFSDFNVGETATLSVVVKLTDAK